MTSSVGPDEIHTCAAFGCYDFDAQAVVRVADSNGRGHVRLCAAHAHEVSVGVPTEVWWVTVEGEPRPVLYVNGPESARQEEEARRPHPGWTDNDD